MKFHNVTHAISSGKINEWSSEDLEAAKPLIEEQRAEVKEEIKFYGKSGQRRQWLEELDEMESRIYQILAVRPHADTL
jgi:hypothetical protein